MSQSLARDWTGVDAGSPPLSEDFLEIPIVDFYAYDYERIARRVGVANSIDRVHFTGRSCHLCGTVSPLRATVSQAQAEGGIYE